MLSRMIYCPVLDQEVEVLESEPHRRGARGGRSQICLDVGRWCTEAVCPVCSVPPQAIRAEMARMMDIAEF